MVDILEHTLSPLVVDGKLSNLVDEDKNIKKNDQESLCMCGIDTVHCFGGLRSVWRDGAWRESRVRDHNRTSNQKECIISACLSISVISLIHHHTEAVDCLFAHTFCPPPPLPPPPPAISFPASLTTCSSSTYSTPSVASMFTGRGRKRRKKGKRIKKR